MDKLVIKAIPENIGEVLRFVDNRIGSCSSKTRNHIKIAVDEIFSNIAYYAYNSSQLTGDLTLYISIDDETAVIKFEDNGMDYNPLSTKIPPVSLSTEEREIGGLGVYIVKNIMDSIEYQRKNDKNILVIRKKLL